MWSTCTEEYYSVIKRHVVLTQATTWMQLEDAVPRGMSQTHKDRPCRLPLINKRSLEYVDSMRQKGEWWLTGTAGGKKG